jgi:dipeptidase E
MNLYLSSYMIGDHADRLIAMTGDRGRRMAIITNALDGIELADQLAFTRSQFDPDSYFASYGFDPSFIDLRRYAGRQEVLRNVLSRHQVIWALGGNTFLLRRAMRESGFDAIIRELLGEGIVYAGWSAGACVVGDSLRAVGIMDEPEATAPGYLTEDVIWDGLGLVPFTILPHYESDHPEASVAADAVSWAKERQVPFRALRDGDVIVVENSSTPMLLTRTS